MKKLIVFITLLSVIFSLSSPAAAAERPVFSGEAPLSTVSNSAILTERETGSVLFEKNADEKRQIASVTKIMTLILVMEEMKYGGLTPDTMITATKEASSMGGSQIYLEEGEEMSAEELIKSVAVASANDAAVCLAVYISGSEKAFTAKMNEKAKSLGMENTLFSNCTGLDGENQYSTARDVSVMARELLSYDYIREFTCIWTSDVRGGDFMLTNTNRLIRFYKGATGLKTGYTDKAGYCLAASAKTEEAEFIAVALGADTSEDRFEDCKRLLDYGTANFTLLSTEDYIKPVCIPAELAEEPCCTAAPYPSGKLLALKNGGEITAEIICNESVKAPAEQGESAGSYIIRQGGEILAEGQMRLTANLRRLTVWEIFLRLVRGIWSQTL